MKENSAKKGNKRGGVEIFLIFALCLGCILFDFYEFPILENAAHNRWLNQCLGLGCGAAGIAILLQKLGVRLFGKPYFSLSLLLCLLVAVNNFPFFSYFNGNMRFIKKEFLDVFLFFFYCMSVGLLEEFVFRGLIFSTLAGAFPNTKKGLLQTFFLSSCLFGFVHLLNIFAGAGVGETLLQVGYSILTGGLFAFVLIKTKNLLCCAGVHAIYNFCGLLLSEQGLGSGVVFDLPTVIVTALLAAITTIMVLYQLFHLQDAERSVLYKRLGVKP